MHCAFFSCVYVDVRCCHIQYYTFVSYALFVLRRVRDKLQWGFIPSTFFPASVVVMVVASVCAVLLHSRPTHSSKLCLAVSLSAYVFVAIASSFVCRLRSITISVGKNSFSLRESSMVLALSWCGLHCHHNCTISGFININGKFFT